MIKSTNPIPTSPLYICPAPGIIKLNKAATPKFRWRGAACGMRGRAQLGQAAAQREHMWLQSGHGTRFDDCCTSLAGVVWGGTKS